VIAIAGDTDPDHLGRADIWEPDLPLVVWHVAAEFALRRQAGASEKLRPASTSQFS
jgi:hypothetical protein